MKRDTWTRHLERHVLPTLPGSHAYRVLGGHLVLDDVGWYARLVWWSQPRFAPDTVFLSADVVDLFTAGRGRPLLHHDLGTGGDRSGHHHDITVDGDDPRPAMAEVARLVREEAIPYLERHRDMPAVIAALEGIAARSEVEHVAWQALEQLGQLRLLLGDATAADELLARVQHGLERHLGPEAAERGLGHQYPRVLHMRRLVGEDPELAVDQLRDWARGRAADMHLGEPHLNLPPA